MYIFVGLGNPGEKYKNNRHNVGFQFIDYLLEKLQSSNNKYQMTNEIQTSNIKIQKHLSSIVYRLSSKLILVKPQTFMNRSGSAVKKIIENWKLLASRSGKIGNLVVIHDDLDIPLGKFKIQKGVGPKLHNGIESIEKALGTKEFLRVRIGVDNRKPESWVDGETYVLQDFTDLEQQVVLKTFSLILHRISSAII